MKNLSYETFQSRNPAVRIVAQTALARMEGEGDEQAIRWN
jgi:hypothetical protein